VAVSTCDPPCEQWLTVAEAGAGAGSSFVIIYRGGGFVSGDVAALGAMYAISIILVVNVVYFSDQ
jgi:hypothetical protein